MSYLDWISDEALSEAVHRTCQSWHDALSNKTLARFSSNIIDPFAFVFERRLLDVDASTWIEHEAGRQVQKTFATALGYFHQRVLGSCEGWVDMGKGDPSKMDIRNVASTIYAEVKNKFNTVTGSRFKPLHDDMMEFAQDHPNCEVFFVNIIAKNESYEEQWLRKGAGHPRLKRISGDRFYHKVTGRPNAIRELYEVLPGVIDDVLAAAPAFEEAESQVLAQIHQAGDVDLEENQRVARYFFKRAFQFLPDN